MRIPRAAPLAVPLALAGLAAADTAASRETLDMDGRWFGVQAGPEGPTRFTRTHREYVEAMPGRSERVLERMWDPTVLVHGDVAVVWTPYDFHVDGRFSHCGVDAFSLLRGKEGWKIAGVVFTMEPDECEPSPLGPPPAGAAGAAR